MTRRSSTRSNLRLYLYDMLTFARDAIRLATGRHREDLENDLALKLALVHLIQTIGEAARKVPESFKQSHPEIRWEKIVGMRHRVVHEYWRVNADVVWDVVQEDLPELVRHLEPLGLGDEPPDEL